MPSWPGSVWTTDHIRSILAPAHEFALELARVVLGQKLAACPRLPPARSCVIARALGRRPFGGHGIMAARCQHFVEKLEPVRLVARQVLAPAAGLRRRAQEEECANCRRPALEALAAALVEIGFEIADSAVFGGTVVQIGLDSSPRDQPFPVRKLGLEAFAAKTRHDVVGWPQAQQLAEAGRRLAAVIRPIADPIVNRPSSRPVGRWRSGGGGGGGGVFWGFFLPLFF